MTDDIVTRLRHWANGAAEQGVQDVADGLNCAADEIERLRNERDEARRMYLASACSEDEIIHEMNRRGWDCFKEER